MKIRIPSIHGTDERQSYFYPVSSLPWARPATLNGNGNDMGQFIIPAKGTRVIVSFEANDTTKPLYFGGVPFLKGKRNINDNTKVFYGNTMEVEEDDRIKDLDYNSAQQVVYKSLKGTTIIIDDSDGHENIKIIDAAGQVIEMGHEGGSLPRRGTYIADKLETPNTTNYIRFKNGTSSIEMIGGDINIKCDNFNVDCKKSNITG